MACKRTQLARVSECSSLKLLIALCYILQSDWSLLLLYIQGSLHCKQCSLQETSFYNCLCTYRKLYPPVTIETWVVNPALALYTYLWSCPHVEHSEHYISTLDPPSPQLKGLDHFFLLLLPLPLLEDATPCGNGRD